MMPESGEQPLLKPTALGPFPMIQLILHRFLQIGAIEEAASGG